MNCQAKKSSDGLTDSNEGRVFGHRSNSRGQLGFEQGKSEVHSFTSSPMDGAVIFNSSSEVAQVTKTFVPQQRQRSQEVSLSVLQIE
ncbi:hypothetical protein M9Y10_023639 [Tritrichomonas musculus]|uniref:Uncharacterized protein n=1 Tax=Tritrichomonas musculus TaxID=1915356 RepID=A0ABR2KWA2_9EUKA